MVASGALTQVAAVGPQDMWLTCDPIITFWKGGYRRYTMFAMAEIEQTFNGLVGFNRRSVATISRSGDLIAQIYMYVVIAAITYTTTFAPSVPTLGGAHWSNALGYAMIDEARVEIGGHEFDRHQGEFLELWEQLSAPPEKLMHEMIAYGEAVADLVDYAWLTMYLYIPFKFWFNRFYEQALPLIALQYHEVKIYVNTRTQAQLAITYGTAVSGVNTTIPTDVTTMLLLVNYVFLDTMERRMFAQQAHEYLIDQVQYTGAESHTAAVATLNSRQTFNHPVQELIWICQRDAVVAAGVNEWFNFSGNETAATAGSLTTDPYTTMQLQLNGHDRTLAHQAQYYRLVQPYQHHSRFPQLYIYCYSFALYPEDVKPSGSCNMSRIDNVNLNFVFPTDAQLQWTGQVRIYARSKNVMKIVSGMAGLMYAN